MLHLHPHWQYTVFPTYTAGEGTIVFGFNNILHLWGGGGINCLCSFDSWITRTAHSALLNRQMMFWGFLVMNSSSWLCCLMRKAVQMPERQLRGMLHGKITFLCFECLEVLSAQATELLNCCLHTHTRTHPKTSQTPQTASSQPQIHAQRIRLQVDNGASLRWRTRFRDQQTWKVFHVVKVKCCHWNSHYIFKCKYIKIMLLSNSSEYNV